MEDQGKCFFLSFLSSPKDVLIDFGERRKGGRKREGNINERETSIGCPSYKPQLGTEPAT